MPSDHKADIQNCSMKNSFYIKASLSFVIILAGISMESKARISKPDSLATSSKQLETKLIDLKLDSCRVASSSSRSIAKLDPLFDPKVSGDLKTAGWIKEESIRNKQELIDPKRQK